MWLPRGRRRSPGVGVVAVGGVAGLLGLHGCFVFVKRLTFGDITEALETRYKYLATRAGDYFRYGLHACHACVGLDQFLFSYLLFYSSILKPFAYYSC